MYISNVSPSPNSHNGSPAQSFLEMLSSGPSRSPSPARPPTVDHEDVNKPSLTNWGFQHLEGNVSVRILIDKLKITYNYIKKLSIHRILYIYKQLNIILIKILKIMNVCRNMRTEN